MIASRRHRRGIAPFQPAEVFEPLGVCAGGGPSGYAQFPGGPSATDGVVINFQAFGTKGTAKSPFNLGRTATHEVGHYLNLASYLGRYRGLQRLGHGRRYAELRGAQLRQADVSES